MQALEDPEILKNELLVYAYQLRPNVSQMHIINRCRLRALYGKRRVTDKTC